MNDEESIELLRRQASEVKKPELSILGWTPERDLLATAVDVLNEMHATLIQINSKDAKRPPVVHMRRPVTALDRIEAKQIAEDHKERVRKFLPRG
jgi:hypothetical protein